MGAPANPAIYHITHESNLASIIGQGGLWCDAQRAKNGITNTNIAHLNIKHRRQQRSVDAGIGGTLADYVPFFFCPRPVMLLPISSGRTNYRGPQEEIVHLVSSVATASSLGSFAFSDRHAELGHALHFDDLADLGEVQWNVMPLKYWKEVIEERQAEFLVHDFFPWSAVEEIGTMTPASQTRVMAIMAGAQYQPNVTVRPAWYY